MKKITILASLVVAILGIAIINENVSFARLTSNSDSRDVWCVGVSGSELCVDSSGNFIPTTDDVSDLGTSSLQFQDGYFDGTVYADVISNDGAYTGTTGAFTGLVTVGGQLGLQNVSSTTIATLVPGFLGAQVYNTTRYAVCTGTATTAGSWIFQSSNPITTAGVSCKE